MIPEKRSEKYKEGKLKDESGWIGASNFLITNSLLLDILKTLEEIRDGEGRYHQSL